MLLFHGGKHIAHHPLTARTEGGAHRWDASVAMTTSAAAATTAVDAAAN